MLLLTLLLLALTGLVAATYAAQDNAEPGPDVWLLSGAALLPWLIGVLGLFGLW